MQKTPTSPSTSRWASTRSEVALLAEEICAATRFLSDLHGYSFENLRYLSGGGDALGRFPARNGKFGKRREPDGSITMVVHPHVEQHALHKNSILRIRDLRIGYAIPKTKENIAHWVEVPDDGTHPGGRYQWLWNPQVDTFEKLEKILVEAVRLGFERRRSRGRPLASELEELHDEGKSDRSKIKPSRRKAQQGEREAA